MGLNGFSGFAGGFRECEAEIEIMQKRVDLATAASIKKVQSLTRTRIKGRLKSAPRWDHRGASQRTGAGIKIEGRARNIPRSGGPGKLSGALYNSIRSSKKPRKAIGGYSGVVFAGGAGGPQNLYKAIDESRYPYFATGVKAATPKMPAVWNTAWAKATNTKK
jgi:hypothetical protein